MSETNEVQEQSDPNSVTLSIDGQSVTVAEGTRVIEAAKEIGLDISAFCYHPGLSIAACCRQCLVEVEGMPKLQPSCQLVANDGMSVKVSDDKPKDARRQMLEFTLLNHPIDCPICDKAGECTLQRHYFDSNNQDSRLDLVKVRKRKRVDLGPHIVLDSERCILCTRCIRVCDEVAGEHQLEMSYRGDHEELGTAPGAVLDNPYSLNTVDVCPVGALTAKDFRFKMRAWELLATPSVCNGCATGCNIEVHHRDNRVWRLIPRENQDVNQFWMCDEGRFTYHALRENRLAGPVVEGLPSKWDTAVLHAGDLLKEAMTADRDSVGVVLNADYSNEANFALFKLATEHWGLTRIYVTGNDAQPERADDILRDADVNANSAGVASIVGDAAKDRTLLEGDLSVGSVKALLVLGSPELEAEAAAKLAELSAVVVISHSSAGAAAAATVALPATAWAEGHGTITNRKGLVQRMHAAIEGPGQALPTWDIVTRLAKATDATLKYDSAKDVFKAFASATDGVDASSWGEEALTVQLRWANSRG
jgi:NADH-quinone oxidoreductase subunit G